MSEGQRSAASGQLPVTEPTITEKPRSPRRNGGSDCITPNRNAHVTTATTPRRIKVSVK
jgi:hypothetical protein